MSGVSEWATDAVERVASFVEEMVNHPDGRECTVDRLGRRIPDHLYVEGRTMDRPNGEDSMVGWLDVGEQAMDLRSGGKSMVDDPDGVESIADHLDVGEWMMGRLGGVEPMVHRPCVRKLAMGHPVGGERRVDHLDVVEQMMVRPDGRE